MAPCWLAVVGGWDFSRCERAPRCRNRHSALPLPDLRPQSPKKLRELDRDGDQALSRAGIGDQLPRLGENFDLLDSDRDGKLARGDARRSFEDASGVARPR
jgi:hypothetical protein